jgi:hypothetical protein
MKISTIIIHIILRLMLLTMITGCSQSDNQVLALWKERQMQDDQRIYGNPYESLNGERYIQFYAVY